jgi:hypothetical protein
MGRLFARCLDVQQPNQRVWHGLWRSHVVFSAGLFQTRTPDSLLNDSVMQPTNNHFGERFLFTNNPQAKKSEQSSSLRSVFATPPSLRRPLLGTANSTAKTLHRSCDELRKETTRGWGSWE